MVKKFREMVRKCQEMVINFKTWSEMVRISSKIYNNKKIKEKYILYTSSLSAEGAKAGSKKRKRSTILPFSMDQSFFFVLFFSLCSNLSIWPGRQFVPDGSRCYIPIFDGLVFLRNPSLTGKEAPKYQDIVKICCIYDAY